MRPPVLHGWAEETAAEAGGPRAQPLPSPFRSSFETVASLRRLTRACVRAQPRERWMGR